MAKERAKENGGYVVNPRTQEILGKYREQWDALSPEQQAKIISDGLNEMMGRGQTTFPMDNVPREIHLAWEKSQAEASRNRESMAGIVDALAVLFMKGEGDVVGWTVSIKRPKKRARVLWHEAVVGRHPREHGVRLFFRKYSIKDIDPDCVRSKEPTLATQEVEDPINEPCSWVDVDYMSGSCKDGSRTAEGGFTFISSGYRFTLTPPTTSA